LRLLSHRITTLCEEASNLKGEVSTLQAQLNVWTAKEEVLNTAPVDFLRRTSDKMQANTNVSATRLWTHIIVGVLLLLVCESCSPKVLTVLLGAMGCARLLIL
jgi:hypothetical protein